MLVPPVVCDTNVFVAAGFRPGSASARLLRATREGALRLRWDEATKAETRAVIERIPPLEWDDFADLFQPAGRYQGRTFPWSFLWVRDRSDRKFAALAAATHAVLVSSDDDLLGRREKAWFPIFTPREFTDRQLCSQSSGQRGPTGTLPRPPGRS